MLMVLKFDLEQNWSLLDSQTHFCLQHLKRGFDTFRLLLICACSRFVCLSVCFCAGLLAQADYVIYMRLK